MKKAARVTRARDVFRRASADRREGLVAEFRVASAHRARLERSVGLQRPQSLAREYSPPRRCGSPESDVHGHVMRFPRERSLR